MPAPTSCARSPGRTCQNQRSAWLQAGLQGSAPCLRCAQLEQRSPERQACSLSLLSPHPAPEVFLASLGSHSPGLAGYPCCLLPAACCRGSPCNPGSCLRCPRARCAFNSLSSMSIASSSVSFLHTRCSIMRQTTSVHFGVSLLKGV